MMKRTLQRALGSTAVALLAPCLLLGWQAGCATHPALASDLHGLQGTWEGVVVGDKSHATITITITGDAFHFQRDTNFWFETTITLPSGTGPQQLHATIKSCAPGQENSIGKVVVAIFKIEDGTLTLAARGDGAEEPPKSFDASEDKGLTLYELRKVQPKRKESKLLESK